MIKDLLVIIPCGAGKIWDKSPAHPSCPAKDVYTGSPFKVNKQYAEMFAEKWVILSAKYGYIEPTFVISGNYDVTFKDLKTNPVTVTTLKQQIRDKGLDSYSSIIGLGGIEYRNRIQQSFSPYHKQIQFPFAFLGLRIGETMSCIKRCINKGEPYPSNRSHSEQHMGSSKEIKQE
jgi:hypothetical protein